ncbi:hypothetical protein SDC9_173719 [bioreactor metagenome]|uniref:Uncharacterized protein n=1 Tax=bioreactor metagenome TaxID=1076179 RepID=A0A645GHY0_9ZZZZ
MVVKLFIDGGNEDIHIGVGLLHGRHALRSGDEAYELHTFRAGTLYHVDAGYGGAARGQHGVYDDDIPLAGVRGKLTIIIHRHERFGVPIKADMAYPSRRNQACHAFHHAKARPQNRNDSQLFAGENIGFCNCYRRLNGGLF